ncbi:hypothetical protein ACK12G_17860 [Mycolicibacterium wolinskyi]
MNTLDCRECGCPIDRCNAYRPTRKCCPDCKHIHPTGDAVTWPGDAVSQMAEAQAALALAFQKFADYMAPHMDQLRQLCEDINRYESDALAEIEDDFYAGRAGSTGDPANDE